MNPELIASEIVSALPSATGSAHGVIPFETVAKALGVERNQKEQ